jgi:hypothetical protein
MSAASLGRGIHQLPAAESSGLAGRLYDRLAARFGDDQVFMDVDTIALGADSRRQGHGCGLSVHGPRSKREQSGQLIG